ncbi:MAG: 50S ribosomal protein L6 [Gammaproteobacteria bacterium]|nr:MAG: 50S ribosomal protein L6 [Gammaproteobacteria bacterium]
MAISITSSRIGRKPVAVPAGVELKLQDQTLSIKGPKGQTSVDLHPFVQVAIEKNEVKVQINPEAQGVTRARFKLYRSIVGTVRANIYNVIHGVSQGFERKLTLVGVGYRAQAKGKVLSLSLGYSHPTDFEVPAGITIETPSQTEIIIKGTCKRLVGLVASKIRKIRPPEPYKGKGVRYANEVIEIKETKKK